ncbi:MAG: hypothetical protein KDL87_09190, partial [Verrucomicrobiae bacterium]|nr:hypothetical protein [Verrucomicrobiae bacterium]
AYGRRGIGRSAAVSFPLGGDFSMRIRSWPKVGDFLQTLNRWLMGEQTPPGIGIRHELNGTELTIDLLYDDQEWSDRFATRPPRVALARGQGADRTTELTWERLAPGHFSVRTDLKEGELVRGAVQVGETALPFGPVIVGTSTEWAFDPERVAELRATSEISGGGELLELSEAWKKPERKDFATIQPWLLSLLLLLVVVEALATRTGWQMPEWALARQKFAHRPKTAKAKAPTPSSDPGESAKPEPPPLPAVTAEEPEKTAEDTTKERKSRFTRAKRGK